MKRLLTSKSAAWAHRGASAPTAIVSSASKQVLQRSLRLATVFMVHLLSFLESCMTQRMARVLPGGALRGTCGAGRLGPTDRQMLQPVKVHPTRSPHYAQWRKRDAQWPKRGAQWRKMGWVGRSDSMAVGSNRQSVFSPTACPTVPPVIFLRSREGYPTWISLG